MRGEVAGVGDVRRLGVSLRLRAAQLRDAVAFLVGRVVFGAGGLFVFGAGVLAAVGLLWLLGLAAVFVVPAVAVLSVCVLVVAALLGIGSDDARRWLATHPVRRTVGGAAMALLRALGGLAAWWLLQCRAVVRRERARLAEHHGEIPITYRPLPDGVLPTVRVIAADPTTWRDVLYLLVVPLYALLAVAALGFATAGAIAMLAEPFVNPPADEVWGEPAIWLQWLAGVTALMLVPLATYVGSRLGVTLAVSLLSTGESARMRAELDEQRLRRRLAVDAAEHERRRIERDLHDGAQQRLVALGMTLGLARQKLPDDPAGAVELVEEAHREAKMAHAELRDLARGIHPAILADRGLDAALSALLRRMPLPVSIIVALPNRPPAAVESTAYFVVSEALTNVSRHAAATRATVAINEVDGAVIVEITDDGVGGADGARGTGLNGLAERVAALGGRLDVDSPPGGPTTIRAEIPCES